MCENVTVSKLYLQQPEIDATAREDYLASLWLRLAIQTAVYRPRREHADDNALTRFAKFLVLKRERAGSGLQKDYLVTNSVYCSRAVESYKRKSSS